MQRRYHLRIRTHNYTQHEQQYQIFTFMSVLNEVKQHQAAVTLNGIFLNIIDWGNALVTVLSRVLPQSFNYITANHPS